MSKLIVVGSKNPVKVRAVESLQGRWPVIDGVVNSFAAPSEVRDQPIGLDETFRGAKNRARAAYFYGLGKASALDHRDVLGVGIESGLMVWKSPQYLEHIFDFTACVIFDGTKTFRGTSGFWELPDDVTDAVFRPKVEVGMLVAPAAPRTLDEAACSTSRWKREEGMVGQTVGLIGLVTDGKVTRERYTRHAVEMALVLMQS